MADINREEFVRGPAVPLSFTLSRDSGYWCVRAWYHGSTMLEALTPQMVAERYLDNQRVKPDASWRDVLRELALAVEDLAELTGGIVRTDTP